jgi:hypothetical protein
MTYYTHKCIGYRREDACHVATSSERVKLTCKGGADYAIMENGIKR